jgi:hypothetical protein
MSVKKGADRAGFHVAGAGGRGQVEDEGRRRDAIRDAGGDGRAEDASVRPLESFIAPGRVTR